MGLWCRARGARWCSGFIGYVSSLCRSESYSYSGQVVQDEYGVRESENQGVYGRVVRECW